MKVNVHRVGPDKAIRGLRFRLWLWILAIVAAGAIICGAALLSAFVLVGAGAVVLAVLIVAARLVDLRRRMVDWWHNSPGGERK